ARLESLPEDSPDRKVLTKRIAELSDKVNTTKADRPVTNIFTGNNFKEPHPGKIIKDIRNDFYEKQKARGGVAGSFDETPQGEEGDEGRSLHERKGMPESVTPQVMAEEEFKGTGEEQERHADEVLDSAKQAALGAADHQKIVDEFVNGLRTNRQKRIAYE